MQDGKLYSISIAGDAKPVPIIQCRGPYPVVSPDGRHVACTGPNGRLQILDLTTGSVVAEMASAMQSIFVGWSPNGQELSAGGGSGSEAGFWIYELDPTTQVTKASQVLRGSFGWSSWSPDPGRMAIERVYTVYYREIWVADLDPNLSAAEALGPGLTVEEHYQELIGSYTRRIEIDPENPDHYASLARVYNDMGDKAKALESLDGIEKRVKDSSRAAEAYGWLGLSVILNDPEFALELYGRAHELQPEDWYYLLGLGGAHLLTGQLDQAIAKFTESTKLPRGENSINYFCLAMAHGGKGQRDEAIRWYEKAMKQMPADRSSMDLGLQGVLDEVHSMASTRLGIKTEEEKP
jgi:tetratricopeptide (TPR) repeat protein